MTTSKRPSNGQSRSSGRKLSRLTDLPSTKLLQSQLDRPVAVRDGGESITITMREAVIRAHLASALKGNAYAQRYLIDRIVQADQAQMEEIAEAQESWADYRDRVWGVLNDAYVRGKLPSAPLPHPDDVVIVGGKPVVFCGPVDEEGLARTMRDCRFRDVLLMQDALDRCLDGRSTANGVPGGAWLSAYVVNQNVPRRFRLDDATFISRHSRYEAMSKRELLKMAYRGWRSVGIHKPRGWRFPSAERVAGILKTVTEAYNTVLEEEERKRPATW